MPETQQLVIPNPAEGTMNNILTDLPFPPACATLVYRVKGVTHVEGVFRDEDSEHEKHKRQHLEDCLKKSTIPLTHTDLAYDHEAQGIKVPDIQSFTSINFIDEKYGGFSGIEEKEKILIFKAILMGYRPHMLTVDLTEFSDVSGFRQRRQAQVTKGRGEKLQALQQLIEASGYSESSNDGQRLVYLADNIALPEDVVDYSRECMTRKVAPYSRIDIAFEKCIDDFAPQSYRAKGVPSILALTNVGICHYSICGMGEELVSRTLAALIRGSRPYEVEFDIYFDGVNDPEQYKQEHEQGYPSAAKAYSAIIAAFPPSGMFMGGYELAQAWVQFDLRKTDPPGWNDSTAVISYDKDQQPLQISLDIEDDFRGDRAKLVSWWVGLKPSS